jgi:hypothetical protein
MLRRTQGLTWYLDSQRVDQDGDVAVVFYNEADCGHLVAQVRAHSIASHTGIEKRRTGQFDAS